MKIKFLSMTLLTLLSANAQAFTLNLNIDPNLLTPNSNFAFELKTINCAGKLICPINVDLQLIKATLKPTQIRNFVKQIKQALLALPTLGQSPTHGDSYITLAIKPKNQTEPALSCNHLILTGRDRANIDMTAAGCVIN